MLKPILTLQRCENMGWMRNSFVIGGNAKKPSKKCPKPNGLGVVMLCSFPELETELNEWILELRQNGIIVTRTSIRLRALQLKKSDKYKNMPGMLTFFASAGWCSRFMERHSLALRQKTKIAQKTPRSIRRKDSIIP